MCLPCSLFLDFFAPLCCLSGRSCCLTASGSSINLLPGCCSCSLLCNILLLFFWLLFLFFFFWPHGLCVSSTAQPRKRRDQLMPTAVTKAGMAQGVEGKGRSGWRRARWAKSGSGSVTRDGKERESDMGKKGYADGGENCDSSSAQ